MELFVTTSIAGRLAVRTIIGQSKGISSDQSIYPAFDPYLAIAEELDIPMSIHVGTGPPGAPYLGFTKYRARLHSPLTIEDALIKHPKLRVSLMRTVRRAEADRG